MNGFWITAVGRAGNPSVDIFRDIVTVTFMAMSCNQLPKNTHPAEKTWLLWSYFVKLC